MIGMYEKILHPSLFEPIVNQIGKVYTEAREEAFESVGITEDARWLEKEINDMKSGQGFSNHSRLQSFHIKCFYKKLLKRFKV